MGIAIAIVIVLAWGANLFYSLSFAEVSLTDPVFYLHVLIQGYLYTGLFITAHDAMHGNVSPSKRINRITGQITSFLFAGLSYGKLLENHMRHHTRPGTGDDPDYYTGSSNFFVWWFVFLKRYVTIGQILVMALIFNILKLFYPEPAIWAYMVVPAFLSTFQLFYFGTYLPHKTPHTHDMHPHNSRTQKANHLFAMLSCYFFGYHYEHHASPKTAWWQLYKMKREFTAK